MVILHIKSPVCFYFFSVSLKTILRISKWNQTVACTLATKRPLQCLHGNGTCRASWQLHFSPTKSLLAYSYTDCYSSQFLLATASQKCSNLTNVNIATDLQHHFTLANISNAKVQPHQINHILNPKSVLFFLNAVHLGEKETASAHTCHFLDTSPPTLNSVNTQ